MVKPGSGVTGTATVVTNRLMQPVTAMIVRTTTSPTARELNREPLARPKGFRMCT